MCVDDQYFCYCCFRKIVKETFQECESEDKEHLNHIIMVRKFRTVWGVCKKCTKKCIENCNNQYDKKRIGYIYNEVPIQNRFKKDIRKVFSEEKNEKTLQSLVYKFFVCY